MEESVKIMDLIIFVSVFRDLKEQIAKWTIDHVRRVRAFITELVRITIQISFANALPASVERIARKMSDRVQLAIHARIMPLVSICSLVSRLATNATALLDTRAETAKRMNDLAQWETLAKMMVHASIMALTTVVTADLVLKERYARKTGDLAALAILVRMEETAPMTV